MQNMFTAYISSNYNILIILAFQVPLVHHLPSSSVLALLSLYSLHLSPLHPEFIHGSQSLWLVSFTGGSSSLTLLSLCVRFLPEHQIQISRWLPTFLVRCFYTISQLLCPNSWSSFSYLITFLSVFSWFLTPSVGSDQKVKVFSKPWLDL